jgi:transposase
MTKRRHALTDPQWARLRHLLPPRRPGCPGAKPKDTRLMIDGALWIARTGAPWRDLPEHFGPWQTVYDRFHRLRKDGTWARILAQLLVQQAHTDSLDEKLYCIDASVMRAHKAAAGAEKKISPEQSRRSGGPCPGSVQGRLRDEGACGLRRRRPTAGLGTDTGTAA